MNLAERIDRPSVEDKEPEILTIAQARSLLEQSLQFGLLPYVALGLFAGLRSAELLRLSADAVKLDERVIVIGQAVAKKRSRRVVEMSDGLNAWRAYPVVCVRVTNLREQHMSKNKTEQQQSEKTEPEAFNEGKRDLSPALVAQFDHWLAEHYTGPEDLLGKEGLLARMTKAVVERPLGGGADASPGLRPGRAACCRRGQLSQYSLGRDAVNRVLAGLRNSDPVPFLWLPLGADRSA